MDTASVEMRIRLQHRIESPLVVLVVLVVYLTGLGKCLIDIAEVTETVVGLEGSQVLLPCDITPPSLDDAVALVLWYKDEMTTPFYSLDARRGSLSQARHAASEEVGRRSYLIITNNPAILQLDNLSSVDEGEYRCRVDFKKARSRNSVVILEVVVPPKKPIIMDKNGEILHQVSGPHNIGDTLTLICEVEGGKPLPAVTWWKDTVLLDDTFKVTPHGVIRNELEINTLRRNDLMTVITCHAQNNNISLPITSSITIDMNLPPLEVQIEGKHLPLSAQKTVDLMCRAGGSRPPAVITWLKGSTKMKRTREKISDEGNITSSILTFVPTIEDTGKYISCRAENPILPGNAIEDDWKLEINFVPQLTLRLGSKLRHSHIQEGNDVYLECDIQANPWVTDIGWRFEGRELHTNTTAGIIVSNQSLVLQKVQRSTRGRYTCTATNIEGKGESNSLYLRVQYSPVCKSDQKWLYGVARHEAVNVTCEIDADPLKVTFYWKFNNSAESLDISTFSSDNNLSTATYLPRTEYDYGTLLCWGKNNVGLQKEPCIFTIIPAGPPDPLQNCTVSNQTEESLVVRCVEGYDGGLIQHFVMEIYDSSVQRIEGNMTSDIPVFVARHLPSSTSLVVIVYAVNMKGRSQGIVVKTSTLSPPESLTQKDEDWQVNFSPVLIVLVSVIVGLVLIAVIIVLVMKAKAAKECEEHQKHGVDKSTTPLRQDTDDRRDLTVMVAEAEGKCPDIIPDVGVQADVTKYVEMEKLKVNKEGILWETSPLDTLDQAVICPDYKVHTWNNQQRLGLKQVPSPTIPQLPQRPVHQPYSQPQQAIRGEWTIPRTAHRNWQTDV
ncbi:neural cell adhesion molecule 2-like isoform X1 [Centruroides vittatus]|uniref:neural cell adhesion molecule 2-like isoform X1 n=1 Tax=Centruroides vittatus TaxID=120091 RepID=UPI00350EA34C